MKIHKIDKQDLIIIKNDKDFLIEVISIPRIDLEDSSVSWVVSIGDDETPATPEALNNVFVNLLFLFSLPYLTNMTGKDFILTPHSDLEDFSYEGQYPQEQTNLEVFMKELNQDMEYVEDTCFFLIMDENVSSIDMDQIYQDLSNQFPNFLGVLIKQQMSIYYDSV